MSARPITLDPTRPLASLREAADLTQTEMAERRAVRQSTISESEANGAGVRLSTLLETADAMGWVVELRARPKGGGR